MRILLFAALLGACNTDGTFGGTAVGNPTGMDMSVGAPKGSSVESASLPGADLAVIACDGRTQQVDIPHTIDLLEREPIELLPGPICEIRLLPGGPIQMQTAYDNDGEAVLIDLHLDLPDLSFVLTGDAPALVMEFGHTGWLDVIELELDKKSEKITPGDPLHDEILALLIGETGLYADSDEDGFVDEGSALLAPAESDEDTGP